MIAAHNLVITAVDRHEQLSGMALSHSHSHGRSHLSIERVRDNDTDGADDQVRIPGSDDHRILTGRSEIDRKSVV